MTRDVLEAWESDNEAAEAGGGLQGGSGASPLSRLVLPSGGRRRPGRRGAPRLVPPLQLGRDLLGGGERPRPGPVGGARGDRTHPHPPGGGPVRGGGRLGASGSGRRRDGRSPVPGLLPLDAGG